MCKIVKVANTHHFSWITTWPTAIRRPSPGPIEASITIYDHASSNSWSDRNKVDKFLIQPPVHNVFSLPRIWSPRESLSSYLFSFFKERVNKMNFRRRKLCYRHGHYLASKTRILLQELPKIILHLCHVLFQVLFRSLQRGNCSFTILEFLLLLVH